MTISNIPSPEEVAMKITKAREKFKEKFKNFHELLQNKKLKRNKSQAEVNQDKEIVDQLIKACIAIETMNVGEGIIALSTVALREHSTLRDRVNELEYELEKLKRDIKKSK